MSTVSPPEIELTREGEVSSSKGIGTEVADKRIAFLLGQLATGNTVSVNRTDLNRRIKADVRRELQLTPGSATELRQELVDRGFLESEKKGRSVFFSLTDSGKAHLAKLGVYVPRPAGESSISEVLRKYQEAFLLFQVFTASGNGLVQKEANKGFSKLLGLNASIANYRRAKLAQRGYLRITELGRSKQYELTEDGKQFLGTCDQYPNLIFKVSGSQLTALLTMAKESPFTPQKSEPSLVPSKETLTAAVLAVFADLLRERHTTTGLVPIPEVRHRIAAQFGADAARHDVLDEIILALWQTGRLNLVPLSDLSKANEQQRNDAISEGYETLYYLEAAHGQSAVR